MLLAGEATGHAVQELLHSTSTVTCAAHSPTTHPSLSSPTAPQMRFLLHAPLQLASVLFAASSTTEVCGRFFASNTSLGCMGAVSLMQLSLGVFIPGARLGGRGGVAATCGSLAVCRGQGCVSTSGLATGQQPTPNSRPGLTRLPPCWPPVTAAGIMCHLLDMRGSPDKPYLPHVQVRATAPPGLPQAVCC